MKYKNETKNCQNCKKDFTIEPEDFNFYEKIKVPPPTFCPKCRFQRRLTWRNEWHLFKKTDYHTGEKIFSFIPEESPVKIYDRDYWVSDAWNPLSYGKEYDFSKPFFEQFLELFHTVPLPAHSMFNIKDSHYCTNANDIKGCYLVRAASSTEDSAYLIWDQSSKQCFDGHMTNNCQLSYDNANAVNCYKAFFCVDCESSHEIILCKDCIGCNNCIASVGLRNKSYCIFNKEYSKEEYKNKLKEFDLGSYQSLIKLKNEAYEYWSKYPNKYMHGRQNVNVSGDYIYESKNTKNGYRIREVEDSKFIANILKGPVKDCYDYTNFGDNAELMYEVLIAGRGVSNIKFSTQATSNNKNLTYCIFSYPSCSDLFGCVSLRNNRYCILNKQYTKKEYEALVPKIIQHMNDMPYVDKKGRIYKYGEFFPSEFSYFPYQISLANEVFPLKEEEAKKEGFLWYETSRTDNIISLENSNIPDRIENVSENILNEAIECAHKGECLDQCTHSFRVIEAELKFYKSNNIPFPRLCVNCRHYERLKWRNLPNLYKRQCMCDKENHIHKGKCEVEFETSYAPNRPEIVYCERCYQQEVY